MLAADQYLATTLAFYALCMLYFAYVSSAWIYLIIISPLYHLANMPEGPALDMVGDSSGSGQPALRRCDNPWKPNAQHGQSEVKTHDLTLFVHIHMS